MLGVRYKFVNFGAKKSPVSPNWREQRGWSACCREWKDFTEMCSGSEAGSYLRLIDFVYHSTPGLRVIKKDDMILSSTKSTVEWEPQLCCIGVVVASIRDIPYNTTSGRDYVKSLRLCRHGTSQHNR